MPNVYYLHLGRGCGQKCRAELGWQKVQPGAGVARPRGLLLLLLGHLLLRDLSLLGGGEVGTDLRYVGQLLTVPSSLHGAAMPALTTPISAHPRTSLPGCCFPAIFTPSNEETGAKKRVLIVLKTVSADLKWPTTVTEMYCC